MIRLPVASEHPQLASTLCTECPQGPVGCCVGPPDHSRSDVAALVARGDRDFLLAEIAAGNLTPRASGLALRLVRRRESATTPRRRKCVYHRLGGCTLPPSRRPGTCNHFLCTDAYARACEGHGDGVAEEARAIHGSFVAASVSQSRALGERIVEAFPEGPPWDAAFLDGLAAGGVWSTSASPRSADERG
jgi:hypothetical protein